MNPCRSLKGTPIDPVKDPPGSLKPRGRHQVEVLQRHALRQFGLPGLLMLFAFSWGALDGLHYKGVLDFAFFGGALDVWV